MSVRTRKLVARDGRERARYQVLWRDGAGVQHGRNFTAPAEAAAFDAAIKSGAQLDSSSNLRAGVGFEQAALHWLATKQATKRPRTVAIYRSELYVHVLPRFAAMGLAQIERRDVQQWVNTLSSTGLGATSVRHVYRTVFKAILNSAVDDGLLLRNPCYRIELPTAPRTAFEPLTAGQIRRIAQSVPGRFTPMVLSAAHAGCAGEKPRG